MSSSNTPSWTLLSGCSPLPACLAFLALVGCGPSILVGRMAYFPPRPDDCNVEVLNGATQDPSLFATPNSEYEIAGTIGLGEMGIQDPFSEKYMSLVKPRACRMGGDAVSLMASHTITSPEMIRSGTSTAYVVLHRRRATGSLLVDLEGRRVLSMRVSGALAR